MSLQSLFVNCTDDEAHEKARSWQKFLEKNNFNAARIEKIDMSKKYPQIFDLDGNKFCINFEDDKLNYHKKKSSIKTELLSKALGGGKLGLRVLDLSAGLGIDAVFLAQLGYRVTAVERNPLIFLALNEALENKTELSLKFEFGDALEYLQPSSLQADVIYFDPMFPEKTKTALSRQEMEFFKKLVGSDEDAAEVLNTALAVSGIRRVVVKRPIKAPPLRKATSSTAGKLVRFDIYNVR